MSQSSTVPSHSWPPYLQEIPQPPKTLHYRGKLAPATLPLLTVVGSRKYTTYGKQVLDYLINGLAGYQVGIVSGLALGIDALAHEAALRNNLYTLAIPGSGLGDNVLYPRSNYALAHRILEHGGGLLSEFADDFSATKWSFIQRNRLMAGLSTATLIIEATAKSGTLTTARMCVDYNRELFVVPHSIFSEAGTGPHQFLKLGATPITSAADIVEQLDLEPLETNTHETPATANESEAAILEALKEPCDIDTLIRHTGQSAAALSVVLMKLEISGHIATEGGIYRRLR